MIPKATGRIDSTTHVGSQPAMLTGDSVSARTNWSDAQNNPEETAVETAATKSAVVF
jgi:hypothetical protein